MASYRFTTGSTSVLAASCAVASLFVAFSFAYGQGSYSVNQEIRAHDLPSLTAQSTHSYDVLATALEIVLHDKEVCCGKNSALEDSLQAADAKSLKDIASKLQGRHLLSDGRPIIVTVEYLTPDQVNARHLIYMLEANHAPLMIWNSHLYVVDGLSYVADVGDNGVSYVTHSFSLQDVRFSDSRREVSFDRLTEDAAKVQGLLFVQAAPQ